MKKLNLKFITVILSVVFVTALIQAAPMFYEELAIGNSSSLDGSSILDLNTTTKGARPCPSMTEAQRDAISSPATGLCIINTDNNSYERYDGSAWVSMGAEDAGALSYDNSTSGLAATTTQDAIDEVEGRVDAAESDLSQAESDISNHISDTEDAHAASAITNTPSGNLAGTNVQAALDELQSDIDTRALDNDLGAHTAATTSVHGIADTSNLVTLDGAETLTNKTLTSPVIDGLLDFEQKLSDPGISPVSGALWLYAKDDKLYTKNNSGTVTEVGSGGSGDSTAKNFYEDPSADEYTNTNYITTYDDGAATPTDGAGGTVDYLTVSFDNMSGTGIGPDNSYYLQKSANDAQGEGFVLKTTKTLSEQAKGAQLFEVKFWYRTSTDYEDGDVTVWLYREGSDTLETCHGRNFLSNNVSNDLIAALDTGKPAWHSCSTTLSDSDTAVHLLLHVATTNADAYNITVDDIFMGTGNLGVSGPIDEYLGALTTTGSWTTNTTYTGKYWRKGDRLVADVTVTLGGAPDSAPLTVDLPSGLSIDTDKLTLTTLDSILPGRILVKDNSPAARYYGDVVYFDSNSVFFQTYTGTTASGVTVTQAAPITFASGDTINIKYTVPIEGWDTGSNILTPTQVDFRSATAKYAVSSTAIGTTPTTVVHTSKVYDSHDCYNTSTGEFTAPATGKLKVGFSFGITNIAASSANRGFHAAVNVNDVEKSEVANFRYQAAATLSAFGTGSTTVDVVKGDKVTVKMDRHADISVASLNGLARYNWVSFEYVPDITVIGQTGVPLDIKSASSSEKTPSGSGHYHALTGNALALDPGVWLLSGFANFGASGTPAYTLNGIDWFAANGADSSSIPADLGTAAGLTVLSARPSGILTSFVTSSGSTIRTQTPQHIVRVTQPVTIYLVTYAAMSTPTSARITAYGTARRLQ